MWLRALRMWPEASISVDCGTLPAYRALNWNGTALANFYMTSVIHCMSPSLGGVVVGVGVFQARLGMIQSAFELPRLLGVQLTQQLCHSVGSLQAGVMSSLSSITCGGWNEKCTHRRHYLSMSSLVGGAHLRGAI